MDLGLRDRAFAIAGGSRGLGFATAQVLVAEGARVVVGATRKKTGVAAAGRLAASGPCEDVAAHLVVDSSDPASPQRLVDEVKDRYGRFDGVLISGGGTSSGSMLTTSDDTDRVRALDAEVGPPDEVVRNSRQKSRCDVTGSRRSSVGLQPSCSPRPRPTRPGP